MDLNLHGYIWGTVLSQRFGFANMKSDAHLNLQYKSEFSIKTAESWIVVFRISFDLDSGFVTRDSWIIGREGEARDPAEVVRERR